MSRTHFLRWALLLIGITLLVGQAGLPRPARLPLATCDAQEIAAALQATGGYTPSSLENFVRLDGQQFTLSGAPYPMHGVNYYPARYPWRRFLTETDLDTVRQELALLRDAGFKSLRLFIWHDALFQCPGSGAVPQPENVRRLDRILRLAAASGFRVMLTLNDLPDLRNEPLYGNPPHVQAQTRFLVERYRNEAAILAWDVRNEGDIDYGTHHAIPPRATREQVLRWLDATTRMIRALDPHHLITAGWLFDADATAPYVDFVSFHHWTDTADLRSRIAALRAATDKPILLEEIGYSTQRVSPDEQAAALIDAATAAEDAGLLGWMVWAAFDFPVDRSCYPSPCLSPDNGEHYFGLWTADYMPKPAVAALRNLLN